MSGVETLDGDDILGPSKAFTLLLLSGVLLARAFEWIVHAHLFLVFGIEVSNFQLQIFGEHHALGPADGIGELTGY